MSCPVYYFAGAEDPQARQWLEKLSKRGDSSDRNENLEQNTRSILDRVRHEGDAALLEYTRAFDCPDFTGSLAVSEEEIQLAATLVSHEEMDIITQAAANIREFHLAQAEKSWFMTRQDGTILGQKVGPVQRAGLYVPGGKGGNTPLVSSLLMGAIPAQVAGVDEIAIVSPPRKDGSLNPYLLAAAYLLDLGEIYRVGGPWAVAALAYGTLSIKKVDVIAGPGNIHVTTAKKMVQGQVGIDMLAGPSEILILADGSATADWVAADMLSQAEHDALASAICVTDSRHLADRLAAALLKRLADLPRSDIAAASLRDWGGIVVVPNLRAGVEIANAAAPEHLEVMTRDPWNFLPLIRHAGAVFLGHSTPEALGDYFAGPDHILPTLGTARFSSALGVQTFCKKTSIIAASPAFSRASAAAVARLARMEELEAHALSMELRGKLNKMEEF